MTYELLTASFLIVSQLTIHSATFACAPAPRNGQFVTINEEAAVIVWDAKTKTEHFIRMASFSGAEDFGFLVPTPTQPELVEASNAINTVSELIRPKLVHTPHFDGFDFTPLLLMPFLGLKEERAMTTAIPRNAVRVLDEQQVAGYNAVVLEADNANSLNEWLKIHGYESRPALVEWLEPYVKAKWKITAFKLAANGNRFATKPVRMSFTTQRPFFPYREPSDLHGEKAATTMPRSLKVFLLSEARMEGSLNQQKWPGEVVWANQVDAAFHQQIASECGLKSSQLPINLWLTAFEDKASPRPGTDDIFFANAATQNITVPPPIVIEDDWQFPLPLDLLLIVGLFAFSWWWRKRKAARFTT
jgi:hypothetical protein